MLEACLLISGILLFISVLFLSMPIILISSPIWLPSLILLYFLSKYLGYSTAIYKFFESIYTWLLFKSDKPRKWAWRNFYNILCWMFPQDEWKTMNYGYAVESETGHTIVLSPEEETERFSYQLYHFMATGFKKNANLNGLNMVEVGSGRGGGLAYIVKNLKPLKAIGVDYSQQQVNFCQRTYASLSGLSYVWGDAENLPLENESVDLVINVESSHCYGNFEKFVSEVARILKKGGIFMITDFVTSEEAPKFEKTLEKYLEITEKKDISKNVLNSLKFDSERRMELIQNRTPRILRPLLKRFSGAEGSNIYQELVVKSSLYLAYKLTKKSN